FASGPTVVQGSFLEEPRLEAAHHQVARPIEEVLTFTIGCGAVGKIIPTHVKLAESASGFKARHIHTAERRLTPEGRDRRVGRTADENPAPWNRLHLPMRRGSLCETKNAR